MQFSPTSRILRRSTGPLLTGVLIMRGVGDLTAVAGDVKYHEYNVRTHCLHTQPNETRERRQQCEDREFAVAILLRRHWANVSDGNRPLAAACLDVNRRRAPNPSYVELLACLTSVTGSID